MRSCRVSCRTLSLFPVINSFIDIFGSLFSFYIVDDLLPVSVNDTEIMKNQHTKKQQQQTKTRKRIRVTEDTALKSEGEHRKK